MTFVVSLTCCTRVGLGGRDAVQDIVARQARAGVGVVNDGEASKIGYSTYVKERLHGFRGEGGLAGLPADLAEFPDYMARVSGDR